MPTLNQTPPDLPGKIAAKMFEQVIYPKLGKSRPEVIVGPCIGGDCSIVQLDSERVFVATTDPLFVMPELGWERAAWFAIHILASDCATSGIAAQYASLAWNLPLNFPDCEFTLLWEAIHHTCDNLGIAIVTGHTGRYEGCTFPTVGAGTLFAIGAPNQYVSPKMAQVGDIVLLTKGMAIETTAFFGTLCHTAVAKACGEVVAQDAEQLFSSLSVVDDAVTAATVGVRENGVTSMHDATERGVQGALVEIADASGNGIVIDYAKIPLPETVRAVCNAFAIDPFPASSEGSLVITCRSHKYREVLQRLSDNGIPVAAIGEIIPRIEGVTISRNGFSEPLIMPETDPFWDAFTRVRDV
ncbi:MAG: AIR synthase family protein [bacterium]|nr:AIR synthase family protein [bacterium]